MRSEGCLLLPTDQCAEQFRICRAHAEAADKDEDAARRAISAIRQGVKTIARQPGIGRPADDMDPDYREWPIEFGGSGYVVLYRYQQQTAVVLAVRPQREAGY